MSRIYSDWNYADTLHTRVEAGQGLDGFLENDAIVEARAKYYLGMYFNSTLRQAL
jgi:hypothetical protein